MDVLMAAAHMLPGVVGGTFNKVPVLTESVGYGVGAMVDFVKAMHDGSDVLLLYFLYNIE